MFWGIISLILIIYTPLLGAETTIGVEDQATPNMQLGVSPYFYPASHEPYLVGHASHRLMRQPYQPLRLTLQHDDSLSAVGNLSALGNGDSVEFYAPYNGFQPIELPVIWNERYQKNWLPMQGDAFIFQQWRTVVVGITKRKKYGFYVLDATQSLHQGSAHLLWRYSQDQDHDLGLMIGQANVVRVADGRWGVIIHNGYQKGATPYLYIFDLEQGRLLAKLGVPSQQVSERDKRNGQDAVLRGLSEAAPIDIDGDYIVDYIYAGDLDGNLWRYDVRADTPSAWPQGELIFTATDHQGNRQAIMERPQVGRHKTYGASHSVMVYIATGSMLQQSVDANVHHSVYGIHDVFDKAQTLSRNTILAGDNDSWLFDFDNPQEQVVDQLSLQGELLICETQDVFTTADKSLHSYYAFEYDTGVLLRSQRIKSHQDLTLFESIVMNQSIYGRQSWRVLDNVQQ